MREEWIVFLVMMGVVMLGCVITKNHRKWLPAVLLAGAVAGSLVSGMGLRFREIVEGPFGFLDAGLTVLCAAVFLRLYRDGGGMERLAAALGRVRGRVLHSLALLFLTALPGILTGSATACILLSGPFVSDYMKKRGVPQGKITQFIAVGAFLGMMMPPNCIPAMIAANGAGSVLPTPYVGFFLPLLLLSLPAFLAYGCMAAKTVFGAGQAPRNAIQEAPRQKGCVLCQIPLMLVGALLVIDGVLGSFLYLGGQPVIFMAGALLCLVFPAERRGVRAVFGSFLQGARDLLTPVAFLFALGSFIEVTSMTGIRGLYSLYILPWTSAPYYSTPVLLAGMLAMLLFSVPFSVAIPAFIAAYAVFPIGWLANAVLVAGCSAALGVSALLPVRGGLYSQARETLALDGSYREVLRGGWVPALLLLILGALMVIFGGSLTMLIL